MAHPAFRFRAPPIQHVRQIADSDCGVACLAMITGQSYTDAAAQVTALPRRRWEHGITQLTMAQLLGARGFALGVRERGRVAPATDCNLVEVVHEVRAKFFHWVVVTKDGTVFDPLEDQAYPPVAHGWEVPLAAMGYHRVRAMYGVIPWAVIRASLSIT